MTANGVKGDGDRRGERGGRHPGEKVVKQSISKVGLL